MYKKTSKILAVIMMGVLIMGNMTVMAEGPKDSIINDVTTESYDTVGNNEDIIIEYVNEVREAPMLISDIGNMSVKENIKIGNISVPLYCTFDSQQEALDEIANNPVIQMIKDEYGYRNISDATWQQYYDAMYEIFDSEDCPSWYNEGNEAFRKLRQFFDIYENESKNNEIISLINSVARTSDALQSGDILELLPYDSYLTLSKRSNFLNNEQSFAPATLGFNINNGISYATSYATSPNKSNYDYFMTGDCTNFTSQILEYGGVEQDVYDSETSGWWHKVKKILFVTTHDHSISWIRADTFAKYMGVRYSTRNHSTFTSNIKKGDFIAADFGDDGDWNHMGFVTDIKSSKTNGYYDYKVAQHTSNYHEWASSSKNGWDNLESDGGKYGRVRR